MRARFFGAPRRVLRAAALRAFFAGFLATLRAVFFFAAFFLAAFFFATFFGAPAGFAAAQGFGGTAAGLTFGVAAAGLGVAAAGLGAEAAGFALLVVRSAS